MTTEYSFLGGAVQFSGGAGGADLTVLGAHAELGYGVTYSGFEYRNGDTRASLEGRTGHWDGGETRVSARYGPATIRTTASRRVGETHVFF